MTAIRFNLSIPIAQIDPPGEFQSWEALQQMARAIEASGAWGCGVTDHPAPAADWLHNDAAGHDALDPFTALAFVAAATSRLMLLTQVVVLPYRNPFISAKAAATLQVLSGGRFIFGVGAGYLRGEFEALGVPFNKRGALMDEAIETIRLAWAGGPVVRKGMFFDATGNEPRPALSTPPPIWIGGGSDKAVERAARLGDGWFPFFDRPTSNTEVMASAVTSVADLATKIRMLHERRAALGKSGPFDICIPPQIKIGASAELARQYIDFVGELAEVGVNHIVVRLPRASRAEFCDNVEWFGQEVIARFTA